jgi:probable HAF family extracellular repeat protein
LSARLLLGVLAWALASGAAGAPRFQRLELPEGASLMGLAGVARDGSAASGYVEGAQTGAALWTTARKTRWIGGLPGAGGNSIAQAVAAARSRDAVAVGISFTGYLVILGFPDPVEIFEAFRWTRRGGMEPLGHLRGGGALSGASAVSADGGVVVGCSDTAFGVEAFRWTRAAGLVGLGDLPGGRTYSTATDVTPDGRVVVGSGTSELGEEAFRWTAGTGLVGLGELPGGRVGSQALAVSADGRTVVGHSHASDHFEAFVWTEASGMVGLGFPFPGTLRTSAAVAVSCDGSVVLGDASSDVLTVGGGRPFYWTRDEGLRLLDEVLTRDYGLELEGWILLTVAGMSDNGRVIFGTGFAPDGSYAAWKATLSPRLRVRDGASARRLPVSCP